jgi:hypothetical protein
MYISKKFMLIVALAKLGKSVNWAYILFSNLHSRLWIFHNNQIGKKNSRKDVKFGATFVVDVIL